MLLNALRLLGNRVYRPMDRNVWQGICAHVQAIPYIIRMPQIRNLLCFPLVPASIAHCFGIHDETTALVILNLLNNTSSIYQTEYKCLKDMCVYRSEFNLNVLDIQTPYCSLRARRFRLSTRQYSFINELFLKHTCYSHKHHILTPII